MLKNMKEIIIHIDDVWLSKKTNDAIFSLYEKGLKFSTSLMSVTEWFQDYVKRYKNTYSKKIDTWLHLTLTSEWETKKTKPVTEIKKVETLVNEDWKFYSNIYELFNNANIEHIIKEIENQVIYTLDHWVELTHIDSHMWVLLHKKIIKYYIELAKKYNLKPFLKYPSNPYEENPSIGDWFWGCGKEINEYIKKWFKVFDWMDPWSLGNNKYYNNWLEWFSSNFKKRVDNLSNWVNYFIFHVIENYWEDFILDKKNRYIEYLFLKNKIEQILKEKNIWILTMKEF